MIERIGMCTVGLGLLYSISWRYQTTMPLLRSLGLKKWTDATKSVCYCKISLSLSLGQGIYIIFKTEKLKIFNVQSVRSEMWRIRIPLFARHSHQMVRQLDSFDITICSRKSFSEHFNNLPDGSSNQAFHDEENYLSNFMTRKQYKTMIRAPCLRDNTNEHIIILKENRVTSTCHDWA